MTCNEAREIARLTRGEKFIGEYGKFDVDSMVNWQPVERTEFKERTEFNTFMLRVYHSMASETVNVVTSFICVITQLRHSVLATFVLFPSFDIAIKLL